MDRLDKILHNRHPNISRSRWQKFIKAGDVLVNNKKVSAHYVIKEGDSLTYNEEALKTKLPQYTTAQIPIIAETEDYIVLNKPSGVLVHEAQGAKSGPLLTLWLTEKYPEIKNIGDDPKRPGIVHRLDKETSGVMVVAKNAQTFAHLRKQFKEHTVQKFYVALVHGALKNDNGIIDFPVARTAQGRMGSKPKNTLDNENGGKKAVTKYEIIKRVKNYTLVQVQPLTGRTHQIRVHFFALGHPIVGDNLYKKNKKQTAPRLILHAQKLCFNDLEEKRVCFEAEQPQEMQNFLRSELRRK